jgi:hypothetical protein
MGFAFLKENKDFQAGAFNFGSEDRATMWALYYGLRQLNPMLQTHIVTYKDYIYNDLMNLKSKKENFFNSKTLHMDIWRDIEMLIKLRYDSIHVTYEIDSNKEWLLKCKRYAEKAAGKI